MSYAMYLSKRIGSEQIKSAIQFTTKTRAYSEDELDVASENFLLISLEEYLIGCCPIGVVISWPKDFKMLLSEVEVAQGVAGKLNVDIAISVPLGEDGHENPYCWWLVKPGGEIYQVYEDLRFSEGSSGLVFKRSYNANDQ